MSDVHINIPLFVSRYMPVGGAIDAARAIGQSGVADSLGMPDTLGWFVPPCLWNPNNNPMAALLPDMDSFVDPVPFLARLHAEAPDLGVMWTSDAIRRNPTETMQTLMTMADITGGRAIMQMGAGEIKNLKPSGHKRSEGLRRLEDHFKIHRKYEDSVEPIDHAGHFWNLRNASVGAARSNPTQLWALGGGPKLIDLATSYADGFATMAPYVFADADVTAESIGAMRSQLANKGRDPHAFGFGVWAVCLVHEDEEVIAEAMANPYIRWLTAVVGRINQRDWASLGLDAPMGEDWHYASKLVPKDFPVSEIDDVLAKVTDDHVRAAWIIGDPGSVAKQIASHVDAGATWIQIVDMLPLVRPAEEAPAAIGRTLQIAGAIKSRGATAPIALGAEPRDMRWT